MLEVTALSSVTQPLAIHSPTLGLIDKADSFCDKKGKYSVSVKPKLKNPGPLVLKVTTLSSVTQPLAIHSPTLGLIDKYSVSVNTMRPKHTKKSPKLKFSRLSPYLVVLKIGF